jgi:hypothetical protein
VLLVGLFTWPCALYAQQDYAKEMQRLFKDSLPDYASYQFFALPVTSFGAGFMYPEAGKGNHFDLFKEGIYGDPDKWWVADMSADQIKIERAEIISDAHSPKLDIKGKKTRSLSLASVLPSLYKLVSANASVDWNKTTTVSMSADRAMVHALYWPALDIAVNGDPQGKPPKGPIIQDSVARYFHAHRYVITIRDVTLTNLTAHVAVNKNLDAKARAQLDAAAAAFAKDSNVTVENKSNIDGSFDLTTNDPVVVAVYIGVPPADAVRAASGLSYSAVKTPLLIRQLERAQQEGLSIPRD